MPEEIFSIVLSIAPSMSSIIACIATVLSMVKSFKTMNQSLTVNNNAMIRTQKSFEQMAQALQIEVTKNALLTELVEYYKAKALNLYVDPELEKKYGGQ